MGCGCARRQTPRAAISPRRERRASPLRSASVTLHAFRSTGAAWVGSAVPFQDPPVHRGCERLCERLQSVRGRSRRKLGGSGRDSGGRRPGHRPSLLLPETASAVAHASDDTAGALLYATATAALSHLTLVSLTSITAKQAAELAATHRLRGADAVYVAVARRYGTTLVSRDDERRSRASALVPCQTPEEALDSRQTPERPRRPQTETL